MATITRKFCDVCNREVLDHEYWDNKLSRIGIVMATPAQSGETSYFDACGQCRRKLHDVIKAYRKGETK